MLLALAGIICFFSLLMAMDVLIGVNSMNKLDDFPASEDRNYPSVSIVFAARNEERNIEHAVRSLFKIDYPNLEIIAVNDRSEDSTPVILDKLSKENPELKLLTIKELPAGWLGKNHALFQGAKESSSELILFTDADIHFEKSSLKRAVCCLLDGGYDHITLLPQMKVKGFLLNSFIGVFGMFLFTYIRPWKAKDPNSSYFLGVGAFNLLKRTVYTKIGTFEALRLRPDDDVKLGKLVKSNGFKQVVLKGSTLVSVEWYSKIAEFVKGLEKNMYAGIDYRFYMVIFSLVSLTITFILPYLLLLTTSGIVFRLILSSILLQLVTYITISKAQKTPFITFIAFPLGVVFYLYVFCNAIFKTIFLNGIEWRGTFYSLDELKKNKV